MNADNPIRVAIVEDNQDLREGLAQLIHGTQGYMVVGAYASCDQLLENLDVLEPAVVLMDIGLPGMSGIEGVYHVKSRRPETQVLMLTVFEDDKKIFDSICAGASGYLLKLTAPARILEAIHEIHEGGAPMTARVARRLLSAFSGDTPARSIEVTLSERERQILAGLVSGLSYKMIAHECSISIDTVRSHIRHIYDKLHVNSRTQAITLAMKNRLV